MRTDSAFSSLSMRKKTEPRRRYPFAQFGCSRMHSSASAMAFSKSSSAMKAVQRFEKSTCDFSSSVSATLRCLTARSYSSALKSSIAISLSVSTALLMVDSGKRSIFSASSMLGIESVSRSPYMPEGRSRRSEEGTIAVSDLGVEKRAMTKPLPNSKTSADLAASAHLAASSVASMSSSSSASVAL